MYFKIISIFFFCRYFSIVEKHPISEKSTIFGTGGSYISILANACPMSSHNICHSNFWSIQFKEYICTINSEWVAFSLLPTSFFFNVCKFLECSFKYMHTYKWLVFTLNILFKLVWENLPHIRLPPSSQHLPVYNSAWLDAISNSFKILSLP